MLYTQLGSTGLTASRLAFGAMNFGHANYNGFISDVDQDGADRLVAMAIDAGINVFDTADIYAHGQSEEILGAALRKCGQRDRVLVATKVGHAMSEDPNDQGLSYRHIIAGCEASLRRLNTDWIDLLQLHTIDWSPALTETLQALDDLVRRGLVRAVGWSNWPAWRAAEAHEIQRARGWATFATAQIYYSLVGRDAEHEVLPHTHHTGLATIIWSPLASGFLSGKYTRENPDGNGGRRASFDFPPVDLDRGYSVVAACKHIAEAHDATVAQVAITWLLERPGVSSVLVGAKRPEQFQANLAAAELRLTVDELQTLDDASKIETPYPYRRAQPPPFAEA